MRNITEYIIIALVLLVAISGVIILSDDNSEMGITGNVVKVPAQVAKSKNPVSVNVPAHAVEHAPGLYYLGQALHEGEMVEGYMFIDYKEGFARKPKPGRPGKPGGESKCFEYLAKSAKWKTTEDC